MRVVLPYLLLIIIFYSCSPSEIENVEKADIRYCMNCIEIQDALNYEEKMGSIREDLLPIEIASIMAKVVKYKYFGDRDKEQGYFSSRRVMYKRKSSIKEFQEYILYDYYMGFDSHIDGTLYDVGVIDFNLGNSALGFTDDTTSTPGKIYMRKPVNQISLTDFKSGYYSILKWLYSLENNKRKVVKEKINQFDHDYYSSPEVKLKDIILEDPWQEEFLFYKYELRGDDEYSYFVSVEPGTYAPIYLYEKKTNYYKSGDGYHINISDMSIRIRFSPEFTGLER